MSLDELVVAFADLATGATEESATGDVAVEEESQEELPAENLTFDDWRALSPREAASFYDGAVVTQHLSALQCPHSEWDVDKVRFLSAARSCCVVPVNANIPLYAVCRQNHCRRLNVHPWAMGDPSSGTDKSRD